MPIRILVADDAGEMRALVSLALRLSGDFDVVGEASDGRSAIALAAALRPDLVLLDLSMPDMDGLDALPRILAAAPGTVVVVFSGFDEVQLARDARRLGAAAYVEKGVSLHELASTLVAACAQRPEAAP